MLRVLGERDTGAVVGNVLRTARELGLERFIRDNGRTKS